MITSKKTLINSFHLKKVLFSIFILGTLSISTSCNEVETEINRIKENRCSWCNSYGAGPVIYYVDGVRKESEAKYCSQKCLMEFSESHNK